MLLVQSSTELTTSATDALLAIECVAIVTWLLRTETADRWRRGLWCWVFGLLAIGSLLGAFAHGLEMPDSVRAVLWKPLYLSLGILVGLFIVGAVGDLRGRASAQRLLPWSVCTGAAFFVVTQLMAGAFIVFVLYEAAALVTALAIYTFLAATRQRKGAAVVASGILLSLTAAGIQANHVAFNIFFPFDHNGVFHLVQMLSTALLGLGLRLGMVPGPR